MRIFRFTQCMTLNLQSNGKFFHGNSLESLENGMWKLLWRVLRCLGDLLQQLDHGWHGYCISYIHVQILIHYPYFWQVMNISKIHFPREILFLFSIFHNDSCKLNYNFSNFFRDFQFSYFFETRKYSESILLISNIFRIAKFFLS